MNTDESIKKSVLAGKQLSKTEEACLCIMAKKSYELIPEQQELLKQGLIFRLTKETACELLMKYVKSGRRLSPENQVALFEVEHPKELVRAYFHMWSLSEAAEMKLFEVDPTGKLAAEYSQYNCFEERTEAIFMMLPNILEDQTLYVKREGLVERTRNRLLETEGGIKFIRQELELRREFSVSTQVKMLSAPHARELVRAYIEYAPLCEEAQALLFTMRKPKKLIRLYASRHELCDKAKKIAEAYDWL